MAAATTPVIPPEERYSWKEKKSVDVVVALEGGKEWSLYFRTQLFAGQSIWVFSALLKGWGGIRAAFTYLEVFDDEGGVVSYGLGRDIIEKRCVSK